MEHLKNFVTNSIFILLSKFPTKMQSIKDKCLKMLFDQNITYHSIDLSYMFSTKWNIDNIFSDVNVFVNRLIYIKYLKCWVVVYWEISDVYTATQVSL